MRVWALLSASPCRLLGLVAGVHQRLKYTFTLCPRSTTKVSMVARGPEGKLTS